MRDLEYTLKITEWKPIGLTVLLATMQVGWGQIQLGDSETEFSGTQGQDGWTYGYRNFTADGGARDYDAAANFIEFTTEQFDAAAPKWDLGANAPWTELGPLAVHPNGINSTNEHWAIRRWTASAADVPIPTLVSVDWFVAKQNLNGPGVTGQLHLNGALKKAIPIAGNDGVGVSTATFMTINSGDRIDLAVTPVGPGGDRTDGSDGSVSKMTISTVVDTDNDLLPDSWEEFYFPGDLTQLDGPEDYDNDSLTDSQEFTLGSDPTLTDTDEDGLEDSWETKDGIFVSGTNTGSDPALADTDGDGIDDGDEVNGTPATNPNLADSDGDGYSDPTELLLGSDPNVTADTPLSEALADSREDFSGVDASPGLNKGSWRWGYRNLGPDPASTNYDPAADFTPFPVDGSSASSSANFWDGTAYDWADDAGAVNPPWTQLGRESTHPNGTNNTDEHWSVRRWTAAGLASTTPVRVVWHARKSNNGGDGVTGSVHLNGTEADSVTLAGGNVTGFTRFQYFNLEEGDIVDLVLTPEGTSNRDDGNDGSVNWMTIDTRIPTVPIQPDGHYFIPFGSTDSDADDMADFWELEYFPGDLTQLFKGGDKDADGVNDEHEQVLLTDPTNPDSDGDSLNDGQEVALGTDPTSADGDGDGFVDRHELAIGYDPNDSAANPQTSPVLAADSNADFPRETSDPQGVNGWDYGYYNTTLNGDPTDSSSFIPFPTNGTSDFAADNFWNGGVFDLIDDAGAATNPPWTNLGAVNGHPNGDNNGEVHWTTRRWKSTQSGPFALSYSLAKATGGVGGSGTTAKVLQNGVTLDQITVAGDDTVGTSSWFFVNAEAGDTLEIALTPEGTDGANGDPSDTSAFRMWVDGRIPQNAAQPDGTPFTAGSSLDALRVTSISYEKAVARLTLSFTSRDGFEYQVERLTATNPVTWTPVGPTITPQAGGETEAILTGITEEDAVFHVLELIP